MKNFYMLHFQPIINSAAFFFFCDGVTNVENYVSATHSAHRHSLSANRKLLKEFLHIPFLITQQSEDRDIDTE